MDFGHELDDDEPESVTLRTPEDAANILQRTMLSMCKGKMPKEKHSRMALLMAALTKSATQSLVFMEQQHPDAPAELKAKSALHAMQMLCASATVGALELFDYDFSVIEDRPYPNFSSN